MYPIIVTIIFLLLGYRQIRVMLSVNLWISLVLLLVFFLGIFEQLNINQFFINILIEGLVLILLVNTLISSSNRRKKFNLPGIRIFSAFSIVLFISAIINSSNIYQTYLFYRFFLTPYLFMLAVLNMDLNENAQIKIIDFFQFLFLFQIVATIVKLFIIGIFEQPVGTIIVAGGGVATYIPLIAAGFLLSRYYIYEKKRIYWIVIVIFPIIAYASQKRGTFIYLPFVFLFFVYILGKVDMRAGAVFKKARYYISLLILSFLILIIGAKKIPMMNPEGAKSGSFDFNYVVESSIQYNTLQGEYTYGRFASFIQVNKVLNNSDLETRLFGFGPETLKGATRGDGKFERFGVGGTYPGISYQFIQIGYLGGFLWVVLLFYYGFMLFKILKKERDKFWKSIGMGSIVLIFLAVIDYLTYSTTILVVYAFSLTIACSFGLMMKRYYRQNIQNKPVLNTKAEEM